MCLFLEPKLKTKLKNGNLNPGSQVYLRLHTTNGNGLFIALQLYYAKLKLLSKLRIEVSKFDCG